MIHPKNRLERRRSAEAKSLRNFKHKIIDGKKRTAGEIRHKKQVLKEKEYEDELRNVSDNLEEQSRELAT